MGIELNGGSAAACVISHWLDFYFTFLMLCEATVLQLAAQDGATAASVGKALHKSQSAIATGLHRIRQKLGATDRQRRYVSRCAALV